MLSKLQELWSKISHAAKEVVKVFSVVKALLSGKCLSTSPGGPHFSLSPGPSNSLGGPAVRAKNIFWAGRTNLAQNFVLK